MADPATITLAVKAAIAAATDKRTWKAVGVVIAAILTPFILIIVMIMSLLSGTAGHNNSAVDLTFHGGSISTQVPAEYRQYIEDMRDSFSDLDDSVSEITPMIESGSIDSTRMKSIFYSLYFGAENLRMNTSDYRAFADCFVRYEERTRTVTDENGNETEETYTVAVPITDLNEIYPNLESVLGRTITEENKVNSAQIYSRVLYGHGLPRDGSIGEDEWIGGVFDGEIYTGGGDFASPLGANWRRLLESDADDEMISDCRLLMELMEQGSPYLTGFDETLFHSIVNQIVVTEQDKLKFCLIGDFAFTEQLPKEVFGR